jgi:DNA-binding beta-propeller fold protein YncE
MAQSPLRGRSALTLAGLAAIAGLPGLALAQPSTDGGPYHLTQTAKVGGAGGFDYVYADSGAHRLYAPRGDRIPVYDLDSLKPVGEIAGTKSVHGVAVDSKTHHGFSSSKPVVMWDSGTLETIKTIEVKGAPDGIFCDPATDRIFVLSHRDPNVTVIDANDGSVVGTVDLGGAPEQGATDGMGRLYIDVEDKDQVAVVDAHTLKVITHYELGGKGSTPAGLALDPKNGLLFVCCRTPATCVVLAADDGHYIANLPLGAGTDGATFNAKTGEVFSSQGDGTLTVIKVNGGKNVAVEQTVKTQLGAKTCTLDENTGRILLITAKFGPGAATAPGAPVSRRPRRGPMVPDSFTILAVGR